jgi:hypothetical protein
MPPQFAPRRDRLDEHGAASIAQRAQELASSGEFEGFNALIATLTQEFGALEVERLRRDAVVRRAITDLCRAAWERKHPSK